MSSLREWFENLIFGTGSINSTNNVITVIGSGGKTSLIWYLAASLKNETRKILVTPTTKMYVPDAHFYNRYYNGVPPKAEEGITLAGRFSEANAKLESLPPADLERIVPGYDLVLIEGDGSKGLPLKAWAEDEPVIPSLTSITIGMLPLWPLGKPISEKIIHRLPLFLELSGASEGEPVKPEHIIKLVTKCFANARGRSILFFNQVEDDEALRQAREFTGLFSSELRMSLDWVVAGSVKEDQLEEL